MKSKLLLGAEAIAQGAIDSGISGVYAYPGTPSTEITEYIQTSSYAKQHSVRSSWSANEKTAYEAALGMAYSGKRALVCMKHVGLNVAADAFINSAITGVKGGLVVAVADDPSMHSSQNEQDTRVYGKFAMVPVLEPCSQQELYDTMFNAFNLSESTRLPVVLRLTTRLSHSRSGVQTREPIAQNELLPVEDQRSFILLPANARIQYQKLIEKQKELEAISEKSTLNQWIEGKGQFGVVAFGIAFNYVMEVRQAFGLEFPVLKIGQYPLPKNQITQFFETHDRILIAEEGYPVYEELLRGYFNHAKILGRLDGVLPRVGELTPEAFITALGIEPSEKYSGSEVMANRPPELCKGCGHRDLFDVLNELMPSYKVPRVFSDIGCYTLGALPPFEAIHTCVDMGASVTMAKGASDAGLHPAVCVVGDSTFTHSGMTGLLDAVNDHTPVTVIISDNDTTAMTGGQMSSATGRLKRICEGIGVETAHIRTIIPLKKHNKENYNVLKEEFEYNGVSVVIAHRECIQTAAKSKRKKTEG